MNLVTLQTNINQDFEKNLTNIIKLIRTCENSDLILTSELALTGYSYDNFEEASIFSEYAIKRLLEESLNKKIAITMIIKEKGNYFNRFFFFQIKKLFIIKININYLN